MPRARHTKSVEFLGGPLDGRRPLVTLHDSTIAYTDGSFVYVYERGEIVEGPRVREVFRFVQQVPLPRREGNDG